MAKTVYWIDDSRHKLHYIMGGIITDLWNLEEAEGKQVVSKILLFGNESQQASTKQLCSIEEEHELVRRLDYYLGAACDKNEDVSWKRELYEKNRYLIQNSARVLFKQWTEWEESMSDEAEKGKAYEERQQELQLYGEIQRFWLPESRDAMEEELWQREAPEKVTRLIELMKLEPGACVGIDLALLAGDRESIRMKEKPIIAMELYRQLKEEHFCFLYSTYSYEKNIVPRYEEIYQKYYHEECRVYRRGELMAKKSDNRIQQQIMDA